MPYVCTEYMRRNRSAVNAPHHRPCPPLAASSPARLHPHLERVFLRIAEDILGRFCHLSRPKARVGEVPVATATLPRTL